MVRSIALFPVVLCLLAPLANAQPLPAGAVFAVNSHTGGVQQSPDVAMDAAGKMVMVWESVDPNAAAFTGILGRSFDAQGTPYDIEYQISSGGTMPAIAMNATGAFVVTWIANDGTVWARRYSFGGQPIAAAFQVATDDYEADEKSAVAMRDDGSFVIVWDYEAEPCERAAIRAQWYDATGAPIGTAVAVTDECATASNGMPAVDLAPDGTAVIVWASHRQGQHRIQFRRYNATGTAIDQTAQEVTLVMSNELEFLADPDVAVGADGKFILAWRDEAGGAHHRPFTANAVPIGGGASEWPVDSEGISAGIADDGDYVLMHPAINFNESPSIPPEPRIRLWDADGPIHSDPEEVVSTVTAMTSSTLAVAPDGRFVVVVAGSDAADADGIYARRYTGNTYPEASFLSTRPVVAQGQQVTLQLLQASDHDDAGGDLTVTLVESNIGGYGISITGITNVNGTISATFAASCEAPPNAATMDFQHLVYMEVTDSEGAKILRGWYVSVLDDNGSCPADPGDESNFNGDSYSDVLLQNTETGAAALWLMQGTTLTVGKVLGGTSSWRVEGTGDFDGDAQNDVILHNTTTGKIAVWLVKNGAIASANGNVGQTTLAWRIKAIGDFDGDSRDDVFVQNSSTGESAVWLINGTLITTGAVVTAGNPAWVARGAGDFNGDYRDDIILQNTNTGEVAVWLMNGLTITGGAIVAAPPTGWQIRTVANIDGDDKADVILQNTNSSEVAIWKMNGFNVVAGSVIGGASGWIVKGAADFNGDATPDILLHSESNGQFAMWRMNSDFTIAAGAVFAQTATSWRPALQP